MTANDAATPRFQLSFCETPGRQTVTHMLPMKKKISSDRKRKKVKSLSKEAIKRIREAEAEATAIRQQAEQEAAAQIEQNERACVAEAEKAIEATDEALKAKLAAVRQRADALIEQSRREAAEDVVTMETEARTHMREAVKLIVWEMFDSCQ